MTATGTPEPAPEADPAAVVEAPAPPPEPWTPRRVSEWNAYYDIYVAAFVLLLAFLGSANKLQPTNSAIWSLLRAGRETAAAGAPVVSDTWSMAGEGRRWVNIPWLFELVHYEAFKAAASLAPAAEPGVTPAAAAAKADQFGAAALIALGALARAVTAWLLLGLRRKGPGLWWTALCVVLALGVAPRPELVESVGQGAAGEAVRVVSPALAIAQGGLVGTAAVAPETWGLMLLALELLLLHHAINLGKPARLYGLIPLFLLWANLDESFAFGLIALASAVVGIVVAARNRRGEDAGPTPRTALIVLAACFGATFVSPSHVYGVLGAFGPIFKAFGLDFGPPSPGARSVFGEAFRKEFGASFAKSNQLYFAALVGIGLASFALNRRRLSLPRLFAFLAASAVWALSYDFAGSFALVFAATLALNGQEWYHDAIGTEGRLGAGWAAWSTGGRLVTITLVFLAIFRGTTGWGGQVGESTFGFGFDRDDFPFEAADALKEMPIEGNVLNTTTAQGDAIAWRSAGKRKAYLDGRPNLYPKSTYADFNQLRLDLRDDKVEKWQPALDASAISVVMIQPDAARNTHARLSSSPNWAPFYDDGAVVLFGRVDPKAPPADVAYFQANRLDVDAMAYRRPRQVPPWERPPTATSDWIDRVFQNRLLYRPQPHTDAARRWMSPPAGLAPGTPFLPDPARCLLAIREARIALSIKPDDPRAFLWLVEAYRLLLVQESALVAGIPPGPENVARIVQVPLQVRLLAGRTRQLLTAMNFAIQTLPPAKTASDRVERANLNFRLAELYIQIGALDLARERLLAIDGRAGELSDDFFKEWNRRLGELNQRVDAVQAQMQDLMIQNRASPQEKAQFARNSGAPGLAIHELEEASEAGGNPAAIRPTLVDLYCETGQPEKALDLIGTLPIGDASLSGGGVGTASYRQGQVYFLLGNYANAVYVWGERAINEVRVQRSLQAPTAGQMLLNGDPVAATRMFLELPEKVATQAGWEFETAQAALEGGLSPKLAADHFQSALKLEPDLLVRPLIAYYLEKLGETVPPLKPEAESPKPAEPAPAPTPTPIPEPAKPAEAPASPTEAPKPVEPPKA